MKKYFEILRRCPLFLGFSEAGLSAVSDCLGATVSSFLRGETVFAAGEKAEFVGIVLRGEVRIERVDYYGARTVIGTVGAQLMSSPDLLAAAKEEFASRTKDTPYICPIPKDIKPAY